MHQVISIHIPILVESYGEQFVRARPLGPWKLQVVGSSWSDIEKDLTRRLAKALPETLPSDLFAGGLPAECEHWLTSVTLPPQNSAPLWSEPLHIELDSFRWLLDGGNSVVRIPAVNCVLFAKSNELTEDVIATQAQIALLRLSENRDLLELSQRFSRLTYSIRSLPLSFSLSGQPELKDEKQEQRKKTSTLRSTASDLTRLPLAGVYGLDDKVVELAEHLQGENPQSVLIVGPAGVGKTSLVHRLVAIRDSLNLNGRKVWSTSGAQIVSGMSGLGMWQQKCSKLIQQAHATRAILHLGSLFELMEAGKIDGQPGVASMVRQSIARGKLLAIAECTPEQLAVIERDDPMLIRAFARMELHEQAEARVLEILHSAAARDFARRHVVFSDQAIEELYRLHARFATYSALPAAVLRRMHMLGQDAVPVADTRPGAPQVQTISAEQVAQDFSKQSGLPRFLIDDSIALNLQAITEQLTSQVIGQSEPVELIVNLIATLKARLVRPGRPMASLMFIGPTGVGKTEMAKSIARLLYSDTSRMIRIDMSEYASPWSAAKLIGKPGEGDGTLTSPIREQPFSVVLLDEFEKADPNVFDILLQVLGEGRLTDSQGRLADFRNAVVIMTSNLGAESFREANFGFGDNPGGNWREHFEREVRKFVRPEFLGRIDRIVPFRPLPKEVVRQIAKRELQLLSSRPGLKYSDSSLEFTGEAIDMLSELGYEPKYGARPLRRAIEQNVTVPLADALSQISDDSSWSFTIGVERGQIAIKTKKLGSKRKSHKEIEIQVINAWQQLGLMARSTQACGPVRDMDNEIERTQRQNEALKIRLEAAEGDRRATSLRVQVQQGQTLVETSRQIRARVCEVIGQIGQQHLTLMVAWHRNEKIDWRQWQTNGKRQLNQLKQAVQGVLQRRFASSDYITLVVTGKGETQLEALWKAYRLLAAEHGWQVEAYWLQEYDPHRDETAPEFRKAVSERKVDVLQSREPQPALRLGQGANGQSEFTKLADAYVTDDTCDINSLLTHACGFAFQFHGAGVESWLESESGIHHFFDSSVTGPKRRLRFRVSAFKTKISKIELSADWLELSAAGERDPRRIIDLVAQQVSGDYGSHTSYSHGKLTDGLVTLMRLEHDKALWEAIGYQGIPLEAELCSVEFPGDVPF